MEISERDHFTLGRVEEVATEGSLSGLVSRDRPRNPKGSRQVSLEGNVDSRSVLLGDRDNSALPRSGVYLPESWSTSPSPSPLPKTEDSVSRANQIDLLDPSQD